MSTPFISVAVPVLNGERTIADCLGSLLRMDYPAERHEILVVDNGSADRTAEIVSRYPVRYVRDERKGLSHARNRGIEESRGEIIASTDCDCVVSTKWLRELVRGFDDPAVSAVAGEAVPYPPSTPAERYAAIRRPSRHAWLSRREPPLFNFMSAAVRRKAFERVGSFDPRFRGGGEDYDFSWRFARAGLELRWQPQAVVFHRDRTTTGTLFRQQIGYGRGQALLPRKHPHLAQWGWRKELAAWKDLGLSAVAVPPAWLRARRDHDPMVFYYPYLDFVRKLGQRIGFIQGTVGVWHSTAS